MPTNFDWEIRDLRRMDKTVNGEALEKVITHLKPYVKASDGAGTETNWRTPGFVEIGDPSLPPDFLAFDNPPLSQEQLLSFLPEDVEVQMRESAQAALDRLIADASDNVETGLPGTA